MSDEKYQPPRPSPDTPFEKGGHGKQFSVVWRERPRGQRTYMGHSRRDAAIHEAKKMKANGYIVEAVIDEWASTGQDNKVPWDT
jgi:hypothetical protein